MAIPNGIEPVLETLAFHKKCLVQRCSTLFLGPTHDEIWIYLTNSYRITLLWSEEEPPIRTIVSPSGIPQERYAL